MAVSRYIEWIGGFVLVFTLIMSAYGIGMTQNDTNNVNLYRFSIAGLVFSLIPLLMIYLHLYSTVCEYCNAKSCLA